MQQSWTQFKRFIAVIFCIGIVFVAGYYIVLAVTPDPGHPWTGVGDGTFQVTGPTALRTFTFPNSSTTVLTSNTALTVIQGGTNRTSLTANNVILGAGTSAVGFVAPGNDDNILTSNGTTWVSQAPPTLTTWVTRPQNITAGNNNGAISSLTTRDVGLFYLPAKIVVNKATFNVSTVTTAGTIKVCVYSKDGATRLINVTSGTVVAGDNPVTVSSVTLDPGQYYVAVGCATTCNNNVAHFLTSSFGMTNDADVPSGKLKHEGTVTHTSGTCNTTLGTVTVGSSKTVMVRLDN
jgi:hypothetical protein